MGRRLALVAAAGVVALVCVRLGFWQLDRLEQRRDLNEQIRIDVIGAAPLPGARSSRRTRRHAGTGR